MRLFGNFRTWPAISSSPPRDFSIPFVLPLSRSNSTLQLTCTPPCSRQPSASQQQAPPHAPLRPSLGAGLQRHWCELSRSSLLPRSASHGIARCPALELLHLSAASTSLLLLAPASRGTRARRRTALPQRNRAKRRQAKLLPSRRPQPSRSQRLPEAPRSLTSTPALPLSSKAPSQKKGMVAPAGEQAPRASPSR